MNNKLKLGLLAIAILLVGAFLGRVTSPERIKIETETIYQEVEKEKRVIEERIVVIERPDGSKETRTEKGIEETIDKEKTGLDSINIVESKEKEWNISLLYLLDTGNKETHYGAHIQRKVLGSIQLGIYADTSKQIGISAGYSF
jgi:hypothetical protein